MAQDLGSEKPLNRGRLPQPDAGDPDTEEYADFFDEDGNPTTDPDKIRSGYIMMRGPDGGWVHTTVAAGPDAMKPSSGRTIKRS